VNWALTAVAGALTAGRLLIRILNQRRLFWDDAVHVLAFLVLAAHGATNQVTANSKDTLTIYTAKGSTTPESVVLSQYQYNSYIGTINNCFLYLVFWLVKVSFLLFYYHLFQSSKIFKRAWWGIMILTLVTFWIPIAGVLATCAGADSVAAYKLCNSPDQARAIKLEYSCAVNIITDVAIMALPLWILKDLKMSMKQKLGLAFIFCLATICIALDIVRVVEALGSNQALYTILEINFVVIICCLPTYRALYTIHEKYKSSKGSSNRYFLSDTSSRRRPSAKTADTDTFASRSTFNDTRPLRDEESAIEKDGSSIYVSKTFVVQGKQNADRAAPPPPAVPVHYMAQQQ
jgi:hypothetical protein